jgi:hypothetical protein
MTTKPPPKIKEESMSEPVKKIYTMVDGLKEIIPIMNDRYRIGYCLCKYYNGESASIREALRSANPGSCTIDMDELEALITEKYNKLNLTRN